MKWMNFGEKTALLASMAVSRLINGFRNPANLSFKHILCIKLDEIGDMCYTVHVFSMLGRQYPGATITLLCKPYALSLLRNDPNIDRLETDISRLNEDFDLIVDLRGNFSTMLYALRKWPAYRVDRGTVRLKNSFTSHPHEIISNYQVVESLIAVSNKDLQPKLYIDEAAAEAANDFLSVNNLQGFAVLHVGSRRELKKWNAGNFALLAIYLKEHLQLETVFTGDVSEAGDIENVQQQVPFQTFSTAGKLTLLQLSALLNHATIYIGNDSGPLHIAALSGIPCIGLFGPGPPNIFYPYSTKSRVLHHILECNPCDQVHCVHPDFPCIQRITLDEVKEKITELLS